MTKRYIFMLLLCLITAKAVKAQDENPVGKWSFTPTLGVTVANLSNYTLALSDTQKSLDPKYRASFMGGVEVEYRLTNPLGLSLGVYYSQQGSRYKSFEVTGEDHSDYVGYHNMYARLQYLQVPLLAKLYVGNGLALMTGLQVGYLLDAKEHMEMTTIEKGEGDSFQYVESPAIDAEIPCKKVDVSIPVGVSLEYMNVVLTAKYHFGLTRVDDFPEGLKQNCKNKLFTFSVGYRL